MANKGFVNPDTKIMADDPVQPYIMDAGGVTDAVGAHIADIIDDRAEEIFTDEKENTFREVKRVVGSVLPEVMADDIDQIVANDEIMNGLSSSLINYSTTEKQIGTWIDGKPLYQKTFSDIPWVDDAITIPIEDIDVVNMFGYTLNTAAENKIFYNYYVSNVYVISWVDIANNNIEFRSSNASYRGNLTCTIQYTKNN